MNNPLFAEVSPEVGEIDEAALDDALQVSPDEMMALLGDMVQATDEKLRARAKELAARIVLDRARVGQPGSRGSSRMRRIPADRGGDIDIDSSFEAITEAHAAGREPSLEEIWARDWAKSELAICLLLDTSGSMSGDRLTSSAITAAACAWRAPGEFAVVKFAREAEIIRPIDGRRTAGEVINDVLALRGHGITGLAGGLKAAVDQLAGARAQRRVVVLLSDCRETDDVDPVPAASTVDELVILTPDDDVSAAEKLAQAAGGKWAALSGPSAAPALLIDLLS